MVIALGDNPPAWYPPCVLHAATGLHCPGCGAARAMHALTHGHIGEALGRNALLLLSLPLLVGWAAIALWRALRENRPPPALPTGTALVYLIAVIAFTLARNLPWWPFYLLAPDR